MYVILRRQATASITEQRDVDPNPCKIANNLTAPELSAKSGLASRLQGPRTLNVNGIPLPGMVSRRSKKRGPCNLPRRLMVEIWLSKPDLYRSR
jgi:hypothetical protein